MVDISLKHVQRAIGLLVHEYNNLLIFFNMSQWKCLPLNITFSPAPIFYSYRILINKCDPKSAGCMANDIFKNLGIDSSVLKINVLNTVINPTAEVY